MRPRPAADKAGIEVVANERYARTDTSTESQVLKVMTKKPDAVMIGGSGTPADAARRRAAPARLQGADLRQPRHGQPGVPAGRRRGGRGHDRGDRTGGGV